MTFLDSIPSKLQEHPTVTRFMDVLDNLNSFKQEVINEAIRSNNFGVSMNKKWLLKYLADYGITDIPDEYPIQIVQQYLLNIDNILSSRGSKIGTELYCSVLSLGEVTVDDSQFIPELTVLELDNKTRGFITDSSGGRHFMLPDSSYDRNPRVTLRITIKSKYFNGDYPAEEALIKKYLKDTIERQLPFSPNKNITFYYYPRNDFYFHKLLNPYFV